jgi:protein-S-isoprenylcysteine O-methyltransferase Ste14
MVHIVYLSFGFAFSELLLTLIKRSRSETSRTRKDRGSMILLWIMITFGFTGGFILANPVNHYLLGAGLASITGGLIIRWTSIIQLGKSFTVDVSISDVARLKTDGIYKRVRHPSYSGLLAIVAGFSLTMNSIYSLLVLMVPVFVAVVYRINVEEKVLGNEFGNSYLIYKTKTNKLIPGIY